VLTLLHKALFCCLCACAQRMFLRSDLVPFLIIRISHASTTFYCTNFLCFSIQFVRHLQDFFGVMFKIQPDTETKTVLFSCVGVGYKNLARKIS
jgi:hypothetical protein